jgi:hypothetical protein
MNPFRKVPLFVALCAIFWLNDSSHGDDKKPEVMAEKISAEDLTAAFAKNPAEAKKKYIADPKEVKKGTITCVPLLKPIDRVVAKVAGKEVTLQASNGITIVLWGKENVKDPNAMKKAAVANGYVTGFANNTITIDCDLIELQAGIGRQEGKTIIAHAHEPRTPPAPGRPR